MNETIRMLYVEDDRTTRETVKRTLTSLTYADFKVKAVAGLAAAEEIINDSDPDEFDLILSDYELNPGTGVRVFELALQRGLKSDFAIYSTQKSIGVPTDEMYAPLRQNLWQPTKIYEHIRLWFDRRRRCSASGDGQCLWSKIPDDLSQLAPPYYYVSMPYDENYELRRSKIAGLCAPTKLQPELTKEASFSYALDHIIYAIRHCSFMIVDLDKARPSVMTEIGMAIALQKRLLILFPEGSALPFNIAQAKAISYKAPLWTPNSIDATEVFIWLQRSRLIPDDPQS